MTTHLQFSYVMQELQALRFLHATDKCSPNGLVKLLSAFTFCGHVCLVLERLHGSLVDHVVHSAALPRLAALHSLKKIAVQLLVRVFHWHVES